MNAIEMAQAMETRASIRRKAVSRKSVQENANDRLADQLDQAATILRQQQAEIEALKKAPTKYCPSEDNAAYEKGFIDGMAKQRDSAVQRFVEGSTYKPPIVDLCLRTDKDGNVLPQREIK